ncbi:hypothetical protein FHX42_000711 [Saccharopolyspora lacisalsi]|uniref:Adhesin domain-containing protein n=1 Tax=Halosaccharopolyspora lacisalsi TaxID=1000566 RepID=A0A839DN46_9PSEU|nr:DUF4097 family beta strand repeat-containing protein [Halosaccharopolyspora lacisalsi]MBA8823382.1 hypothetical protein [Halosaccharopolyspora lacisalsi]
MSQDFEDGPHELVRTNDFDTERAIELDISNHIGPVTVELTETALTHVEIRHDPESGSPDWRSGLSGLLSWVSEQIGDNVAKNGGGTVEDSTAEALRQTRIDMTGNRLAVHPPGTPPLRTVPLAVKVQAPTGSQVGVRTGSGTVTITGEAGKARIQTGSGDVTTQRVTGSATVRTGSGQLRLGAMPAGVHARSGSGEIEIAALEEASSVVTGNGDVWLGTVGGDVLVRSGSGTLSVADAASGKTELITGSGGLHVAVRHGTLADVDLTSSTGTARSELVVSEEPPPQEPALRIFGRTGSGEALITSAV